MKYLNIYVSQPKLFQKKELSLFDMLEYITMYYCVSFLLSFLHTLYIRVDTPFMFIDKT